MAVETSALHRPRTRHSGNQLLRRITTNVLAGGSTSPKLEKHPPYKGIILSPPQSTHRGSSHHTAAPPTLNDKAGCNPACVVGHCRNAVDAL